MNKKAQIKISLGLAVFLVVIIVLFILIGFTSPVKEILDDVRGGDKLNCPGTPTFNETLYNNNATNENSIIKRAPCFITGIGWVYFVLSVFIAIVIWAWKRFNK